MRVTSSSFYSNIYGENNKINRQLFDVHKQISSGLNIQYADEDPITFIKTLRLDDEITTFSQIKNSVENAFKMSTQTDTTINEIVKAVESIKVKLIYAANETHSETSMQAIANELRGLQVHMQTLANSSINGQFLFSGSAVTTKPIDVNGVYHGNDTDLEAFMGSGVKQKYNISGAELFLGEEKSVNRTVSTNIPQNSLIDNSVITASSTIRDLMGDDTDAIDEPSYFYLQGARSDGSTFKSKITMGMNDTVEDLLKKIALTYDPDPVSISLNSVGQIEIIDKRNGSSKIDFHMVGAVDFSGGTGANVTDIDDLQTTGTTDFTTAITAPGGVYVKEFTRSGLTTPASTLNTIEGINYDRTNFVKEGAKLLSNISQIVNSNNAFTTPSTKLIDAAGVSTMNGTRFKLEGTTVGGATYTAQIDFGPAGSTFFSLDGGITKYPIYNASTPRTAVAADEMTYQQLMDVINMVVTGTIPGSTTSDADYDTAITTANTKGSTTLDYAGRLVLEDKTATITKAALSIYDNTSDTYPATEGVTNGPSLVFNANSALTVRDPKNDFFTRLEEIIQSVEQGKYRADGSNPSDPRNGGIQNAIQMIDDLHDHVIRVHTEIGSYSQLFDITSKRTDMLIVSAKTLRSEVLDTDIAEATLRLQQLNLNYQAMFSSISKVSQLSLVNYL